MLKRPQKFTHCNHGFSVGIWMGNDPIWDKVWHVYLRETNPSEKWTLLEALAFSQESGTLSRLLQYAQSETLIRRQDYFLLCRSMASHPVGNAVIWNYYRYHSKQSWCSDIIFELLNKTWRICAQKSDGQAHWTFWSSRPGFWSVDSRHYGWFQHGSSIGVGKLNVLVSSHDWCLLY